RGQLFRPATGVLNFFNIFKNIPFVFIAMVESVAKRHLLSEDIVRLQDFQQRKLAVFLSLALSCNKLCHDLFREKLQRKNELILKNELKLLIHLCQSADDMVIARDAIYRYSTSLTDL
uniref:Uncharacterized protein n=1 Tax=Lates calcarifer TaxID=8187 RepID=A0A4W6BLP0_LATCA